MNLRLPIVWKDNPMKCHRQICITKPACLPTNLFILFYDHTYEKLRALKVVLFHYPSPYCSVGLISYTNANVFTWIMYLTISKLCYHKSNAINSLGPFNTCCALSYTCMQTSVPFHIHIYHIWLFMISTFWKYISIWWMCFWFQGFDVILFTQYIDLFHIVICNFCGAKDITKNMLNILA